MNLLLAALALGLALSSDSSDAGNLVESGTPAFQPTMATAVFDLKKIESDFTLPNQVAVARDWKVNLDSGVWTYENGLSVWTYNVDVPGVARVFFVDARAALPAGSTIVVSDGAKFSNEYFPSDIINGKFSPALVPGSRLVVEIFTRDKEAVRFAFDQLYVGITTTQQKNAEQASGIQRFNAAKSGGTLPPACRDGNGNPSYNDDCRAAFVVNYMCHIGTENYRISRGSVGLLITSTQSGRTLGCSGTLVNNQRSDGKNYILTARHCTLSTYDFSQNTITAYWDRTNSCGETQESFSSQTGPVSNGYVTVHQLQRSKNANDSQESDADSWLLSSTAAIPNGASPLWQPVDARDTSTAAGVPQGSADSSFTSVVVVGNGQAKTKQYLANTNATVLNGDTNAFGGAVSWVASFIDQPSGVGSNTGGLSGSGFFDQSGNLRGINSSSSVNNTDRNYFFRELAPTICTAR